MKVLICCLFFWYVIGSVASQTQSDTTVQNPVEPNADDPSQFLTRVEVFNEFQHYDHSGGFHFNQTVVRTIVKIGKKFTTRLDVPLVSNSFPFSQEHDQFGLGDVSFRLLGYKIRETKRSAVTASIEISLNTASSPAQGTGKNLLIPLITFSHLLKNNKSIAVLTFQQTNSISGDEERPDYSFSKLQGILLRFWSKKVWTVLAPELFIDYIQGGTSMILKGRMAFAPSPRINLWIQANAGLYGDFVSRYDWGAETGCRYFMVRKDRNK